MPAYDAGIFAPPAPVAQVILRRAESGNKVANVPMLLDSGADVTLIPQSVASHLGAITNVNQSYELIGFDGKKSTVQAVQLDLLLLGRCFSGRFLLIDQAWGILGRDILNHLTLILDGPRLCWNES